MRKQQRQGSVGREGKLPSGIPPGAYECLKKIALLDFPKDVELFDVIAVCEKFDADETEDK